MSELLTISEAAERCRLSTKTLRRHIASGRLVAYRIGPRALRIKSDDLEAMLQQVSSAR